MKWYIITWINLCNGKDLIGYFECVNEPNSELALSTQALMQHCLLDRRIFENDVQLPSFERQVSNICQFFTLFTFQRSCFTELWKNHIWHMNQLLGNGREISIYKSRCWVAARKQQQRNSVFCGIRTKIL